MSGPPQPQPPTLEVVDSTRLKIKWEGVSCKPPPTSYAVALTSSLDGVKSTWYVDRSGNAHSDKKNANVFGASCRSVTVVDLAMGPSYRAQISVKDGEKWSAYSDLCEPCVISNPEPPAAPMLTVLDESSMKISWLLDDLGCEPKPTRVSIAWTNTVGGPGITYLDKHGGHHTDKVPTIDTGAKEVIVKFLRTNVPYQAQMAVQNAVGWSKYSPFCPPDKISKPIQLDPPVLEVVHGDRIQVIWEPPRLGLPCTAYAVALNDGKVTLYLDAKGAPHDNKDNASIIPATQTSIMVPLLLENVPYKAQVASRNALGWGPYSAFSKTETVVKEKKKAPLVATEDDFEIAM